MVFVEAKFIFTEVGRIAVTIGQFFDTVATEDDAIHHNVIPFCFKAASGKSAFSAEETGTISGHSKSR